MFDLLFLMYNYQDFARLLMDALSAGGVSADDLDSWKAGALRVFVNGIAPKNWKVARHPQFYHQANNTELKSY